MEGASHSIHPELIRDLTQLNVVLNGAEKLGDQNHLRKGSWSVETDGDPPTSSLFSGMYLAVVPFDLRIAFFSRKGFYGGKYSGW